MKRTRIIHSDAKACRNSSRNNWTDSRQVQLEINRRDRRTFMVIHNNAEGPQRFFIFFAIFRIITIDVHQVQLSNEFLFMLMDLKTLEHSALCFDLLDVFVFLWNWVFLRWLICVDFALFRHMQRFFFQLDVVVCMFYSNQLDQFLAASFGVISFGVFSLLVDRYDLRFLHFHRCLLHLICRHSVVCNYI